MPPLMNDLRSLLPATHPTVSAPLGKGGQAPALPRPDLDYTRPTIVAFVRHCGCPFAEREVRELSRVANEEWSSGNELQVVVVCMSVEGVAKEWFEAVG